MRHVTGVWLRLVPIVHRQVGIYGMHQVYPIFPTSMTRDLN